MRMWMPAYAAAAVSDAHSRVVSRLPLIRWSRLVDIADGDGAVRRAMRSIRWRRLFGFAAWFVLNIWLGMLVLLDTPAAAREPLWVLRGIAVASAAFDTLVLHTVLRLTARFPIGPERFTRHLSVHALAALGYGVLRHFPQRALYQEGLVKVEDVVTWPKSLGLAAFAWMLLAIVAHTVEYARRYRKAQLLGRTLREELGEAGQRRMDAELRALKSDLNPHFLSNALRAVAVLLRSDPGGAERILGQLGGLQRAALARARTQEVTLREELEMLEPFLAIERARLARDFVIERDIAPEALDALVPDTILQPLVEHAVRRGLACTESGRLRIVARRGGAHGEALELQVAAAGCQPPALPMAAMAPAIAAAWVANARARLAELYGTAATLRLSGDADAPAEGVASVTIPWRDDDAPATAEGAMAVAASDARSFGESGSADREPTIPRGSRPPRHRRLHPGWIVSLIVFSCVFFPVHRTITRRGETWVVPVQHWIIGGLVSGALITASAFIAFRLTRRRPVVFPRGREAASTSRWAVLGRAIAFHLAVAIAVGLTVSAIQAYTSWSLGYLFEKWSDVRFERASKAFLGAAAVHGAHYVIAVIVAHCVEFARRYRSVRTAGLDLRVQIAEVGRRRVESELRALKSELNPHFLGNALHTVSALVRIDRDAAGRVLAQLDELLRTAIMRARTQEVSLREELETLEPFLAVEEARLGRPLDVTWDVEESALCARVPHMMLQPLVENAVKHGLAPRRGAGHIAVAARRRNGSLELSVRDDGVGLGNSESLRGATCRGLGLANTRARLTELYGDAASFELVPGDTDGAVARLMLPWCDADSLATPTPAGAAPEAAEW